MNIKKLKIQNFRNLHQVYYEAESGINIFLGDNAQGKTSFLEAIYLLSRPFSFRPAKDIDILKYNQQQFLVEAQCKKNDHDPYKISIHFYKEKGKKEIFINEKKTNYKDQNIIKVVLFTPEDLYLVKGTPNYRRRYLDFILCQLSPLYDKNYHDYYGFLKRRNFFIKIKKRNTLEFEALNELFIQSAVFLLWERIQLSFLINQFIKKNFPLIFSSDFEMQVRYALSFPLKSDIINKDNLEKSLRNQLKIIKEKEDLNYKTLSGPHLDDLNIYLNHRLAKNFASQGQQRSVVITLKIAEVMIYKKFCGEYPIFLLDEILSELDLKKKQQLFNWLKCSDIQSFLTAIHLEGIKNLEETKITRFYSGGIK